MIKIPELKFDNQAKLGGLQLNLWGKNLWIDKNKSMDNNGQRKIKCFILFVWAYTPMGDKKFFKLFLGARM